MRNFSLNGRWKFHTDPNCAGETRPEQDKPVDPLNGANLPEYDDAAWAEMPVPSHWQSHGIAYNGAAWYRRTFVYTPADDRTWLCLTADYYCDAWLNGYYLGSHEGFFAPARFEVTDVLREGENTLAVRVDAPQDQRDADVHYPGKKQIKGAISDWDANDRALNPGGLWGDVYLESVPSAFIASYQATALFEDNYESAILTLNLEIDSALRYPAEGTVRIDVKPRNFDGPAYSFERALTMLFGAHDHALVLPIEKPALWYCRDMGAPNLYDLTLTLTENGKQQERSCAFGFREIRRGDGWAMYLNGKRLYLRGANYLSDQLLSTMDKARYETDIDLALGANMNMLRLFCVVEKEAFYQLCDERGLLVYQDFPIQWSMSDAGDLVRRATAQCWDMVLQLYNHPSIILWCFGSEPRRSNFEKLGYALSNEARRLDPTRIVDQANSWHELMDFEEMKHKYDWRVDNHFYPGWYYKVFGAHYRLRDMDISELDLVTEFGAQGLPDRSMMELILPEADRWPMNEEAYKKVCCQPDELLHWTGPCETLDELIEKSQDHQALVLRFIIEYLRRRRYAHPGDTDACNNGALLFLFSDCRPMITWSIIDYARNKKKAYDAVRAAFSPLFVGMDWPLLDDATRAETVCLFAVNDTQEAYGKVAFEVAYYTNGGDEVARQALESKGELGANCLIVSEPISLCALPGAACIHVILRAKGTVIAENRYALAETGPGFA